MISSRPSTTKVGPDQTITVGPDGVVILIAALATYLGHVSPASTYWYLTASPELLDLVNDRVEAHREGRIA